MSFIGGVVLGAVWYGIVLKNQSAYERSLHERYRLVYIGAFSETYPETSSLIKCKSNPKGPFKADLYIKDLNEDPPCACRALKKDILATIRHLEATQNGPIIVENNAKWLEYTRKMRQEDLETAKRPLNQSSVFAAIPIPKDP